MNSTQKRSVEEIMAAARKKATSFVSGSTASDADAPAYAAAKAKEQVKATPKVANSNRGAGGSKRFPKRGYAIAY